MADSRSLSRVDTGVPGLDTILNGGLFKGGVYIVEGPPGTGKTILGNPINGKLGLDSLAERPTDLVLTDLMTPVMDGPEMIRRMRADPRFAAIPAVLMTALPEAIPIGDAAKHDAVLVKPFSLIEVLELVRRLVPPR